MLEYNYNLSRFNILLLLFRIKYYFNETSDALLRHKVLMIFLTCLLLPSFRNIKLIGIPFCAIIDPKITFTTQCITLFSLLIVLSFFICAQEKSIKGGELRNYFFTLGIPSVVDKKIDLIVLAIAMNITWLGILFGVLKISTLTNERFLLSSYYILYLTIIVGIVVFLLNVLYKNIANCITLIFLLVFVTLLSRIQNPLLNFVLSFFLGLSSMVVTCKARISQQNRLKVFENSELKIVMINPLKLYTFILLKTLKANKTVVATRYLFCILLTILLAKALSAAITDENLLLILLILIGFQSYIISTLSIIFSKNELNYKIFHSIFEYKIFVTRTIEITSMIVLLATSAGPLILFVAYSKPYLLSLMTIVLLANTCTIATNRILYVYSFRFCFLTTCINTWFNTLLQYLFIGAASWIV